MDTQHVSLATPRMAYSLAETETLAGLSRATLYRLIAAEKLLTVKVGRRRLIPRAQLEALLHVETTQ